MDQHNNDSNYSTDIPADGNKMELYSIVVSTTVLLFAILFGGGGCITVLIAMFVHRLLQKLRFILIAILLVVCCIFDLIWCPIEITRLVLHHQNINGNTVSSDAIHGLKYVGSSLYISLLCTTAAMVVLICVQNLLKIVRKYDNIPKLKLGIIFILIWLIISISLTIAYILVSHGDQDDQVYHSINKASFHFKIGLQALWIVLLLIPVSLMMLIHLNPKFWKTKILKETSDLHSTDNFTVPSLIIKSVEEIGDEDNEEESSIALPSPDVVKDSASGSGSPVSKSSKSALKKRSGSPSSQKVVFADTPSPTREEASPSPKFGERFKSPNHLGVNMAAILGRRRHTIAQISDPHLDLMQKAKTYTYVRKFSVDISALQAQLENPKLSTNFPFHSQQDIKASPKDGLEKQATTFGSQQKCTKRSRDEIIQSQEIAEESENELENEMNDSKGDKVNDKVDTSSLQSQNVSNRSMHSQRDSICPTPPLISLTKSDGEEKQLEINSEENILEDSFQSSVQMSSKLHKPCKLSCLLVATFILSIIPMFVTELLRDHCLSPNAYINIVTCMTAITTVQTMIYPQVIFCVDANINKAVHRSLTKTRMRILQLFTKQHPVSTTEDISDTEV